MGSQGQGCLYVKIEQPFNRNDLVLPSFICVPLEDFFSMDMATVLDGLF